MNNIATIILAAGKGTRMKKSDGNKVVIPFHGKPLIVWAVETALSYCSRIVVVVGAHETSVRLALKSYPIEYAQQLEQKGTAHATELGMYHLSKNPPHHLIVGYGDHMMFYTPEMMRRFIQNHIASSATISLVTANYTDQTSLTYGRIIRSSLGDVARIVEQKDATDREKTVTEINAGLYCFDFSFLQHHIGKIKPSPVSQEYYLTDMVEIANIEGKKVLPFVVPFTQIGYGINSKEDLEKSLELKKQSAKTF